MLKKSSRRPLRKHAEALRLPGESEAQLFSRLKSESKAAPQRQDETEGDFFWRLVWNAFSKRTMRSHPEIATRRRAKVSLALTGETGLEHIAENARRRSARRADRSRAALDAAKSGPCLDCNQKFPPECMDFDHRPGEEKRFALGVAVRMSWPVLEAEIAKCDLVCANCHRIRTVRRLREKGVRPR